MCACTCVVTQHMTSTQRTPKSSRTWQMARRRAVGNEPKGDVGEYSTISRKNIICNNSREIKVFTKKSCYHDAAICVHHVIMVVQSVYIMLSWWWNLCTSCYHGGAICVHPIIMVVQSVYSMLSQWRHLCTSCYQESRDLGLVVSGSAWSIAKTSFSK